MNAQKQDQGGSLNTSSALQSPKYPIFWRIYFVLITLISVLGMVLILFEPSRGVAEFILLGVVCVSTIGLCGFTFGKAFFTSQFWKVALIVEIAFSLLYYFITNIDLKMDQTDAEFLMTTAVSWAISLPSYYALYLYSKQSNVVWHKSNN